MENSALPVHITVISPASAKSSPQAASGPGGPTAAPGEASKEFSELLNTQKLLQAAATEGGALTADSVKAQDLMGPERSEKALSASTEDQSASQAAVPDSALFLPVLTHIAPAEQKGSDKGTTETCSQVLSTDILAWNKPAIEPGSQAANAAKDAASPAKLASSEKPASQLPELLPKLDAAPNNNPFSLQMASFQTTKANYALPWAAPTLISIPVGEAGWDRAFSQRVTWVATTDQQSARIELNPPNLGPLEVRINLHQDQASAVFSSPHGAVRDAIEAALPKLREMLAESGLTMGSVNVSAQFSQQQQQQAQSNPQTDKHGHFHVNLPAELAPIAAERGATEEKRGLVDIFA